MSAPPVCDEHKSIVNDIARNRRKVAENKITLKGVVAGQEVLFKKNDENASAIVAIGKEVTGAIADLKVCITKENAARDRRIYDKTASVVGKIFKALLYILAGSIGAGGSFKLVGEAIKHFWR